MVAKITFGALLGATIGLGLHLLLAPVLGGTCQILCDPYRSIVAGAILIGFLGFILRIPSGVIFQPRPAPPVTHRASLGQV